MPHGIDKATDLIAQRQPAGDATVFSSGDELSHRRGEAVSGQLTGLLQNAFLRGKIHDAADKEIGDVLTDLLSGLVFEHPFIMLMNEYVLLIACLDGQH